VHKSLFLNKLFYAIGIAGVFVFVLSYFIPWIFPLGGILFLLLAIAVLIDLVLCYAHKRGVEAERKLTERFSLGDNNKVLLTLKNNYVFPAHISVIDELPIQFQDRNWIRKLKIPGQSSEQISYTVRPVSRGEYGFGNINVFINGPLQLVKRKYTIEARQVVKVYPSYMQMRRFQLMAITNRAQETGVKRMRKLGHSMEFEQIKEYVRGDDFRTINWKATARKSDLMVNNYTDERSQQIYCVINKGRLMKMPFEGLTLLDYAVNASLVLSSVALTKQDKAGLITFAENLDTFIQADKKPTQINKILEALYNQQTHYLEQDFEKLYAVIRNRITNRGLIVLFTNFESMEGLQRNIAALKKIAEHHLLLVVFFENTELKKIEKKKAASTEEIYIKTIAEKFAYEKRLIVKELHKQGILSILTPPQNLSVNTVNKYLELKNRMSI
jgi:uncharacterized protein (DUF58 family)